jgi:hypothetical protein
MSVYLMSEFGPYLTNRSTSPMSGIGPEADAAVHDFMGFDPSLGGDRQGKPLQQRTQLLLLGARQAGKHGADRREIAAVKATNRAIDHRPSGRIR